jgi:hypothetical protein
VQVSQNELSELTGKDRKTVRRLLAHLNPAPGPHRAKLYDSKLALETLYLGTNGNGFITTAEAVRRLTIAKEKEIVLNMEIKRGARIPIEDVSEISTHIFRHMRGIIVASKLTPDEKNEILDRLRELPYLDGPQNEDQKCHPTLWQS